MNAPPDVFATLADGIDRRATNLQDLLKPMKRLFICGLALDFCVMDTCLNARALGFDNVFMVLDAARAAHIPGVGTHGSGFLSDPKEVLRKLGASNVGLLSAKAIGTGARLSGGTAAAISTFPSALLPIELSRAKVSVTMTSDGTYTCALEGNMLAELKALNFANVGKCSPTCAIPPGWDAPKQATSMCWAYPMEGTRALHARSQLSFLGLSTSAELRFAAYGGFLLCDRDNVVVAVQSIDYGFQGSGQFSINFAGPRRWRNEFTAQFSAAGRFQPVTLPELQRSGATQFCWLPPGEKLTSGPEDWVPSSTGGFLYQLDANQPSVYFPIQLGSPDGEAASESDVKVVDTLAKVDVSNKGNGGCCVLQ